MSVKWTKEQQQVIDLRDCNILVSAAAGSGKTAVLVERIIGLITDPKRSIDIDRLLIVTFTKAAAGEMRERIRSAIEQKLESDSGNEHLERQLTLVHHAQITTIHSFCQHVIRNYFHLIDLDPGFRIADEGELKLLKNDIATEVVEDYYEQGSTAFLNFIECYATGKNDHAIEGLILQMYDFSMSSPWPVEWLAECSKAYEIESVKELCEAPWMMQILAQIRLLLADAMTKAEQALAICALPDGPHMYAGAIEEDVQLIATLQSAADYSGYAKRFATMPGYGRLSGKRDEAVSDAKREQVKNLRDQMKSTLSGVKEQYFYAPPEVLAEDIKQSRESMQVLTELTITFLERFEARKREKNLLDFNDLEHLALAILTKKEDDVVVPSEAARQFSEQFEEIMIDEYQDSNLVQEHILTAVSRQDRGQYNIFMVGDVKQSIYRFRLARPELFMEKYESYSETAGTKRKIELHQNFRSRSEVLDSANTVFAGIMKKDLGNVEYDDKAALHRGREFPPHIDAGKGINGAEILLFDPEQDQEARQESGETDMELEARMVGMKIREIVGEMPVLDKQTEQYRPARYSDIVILLRTVSGWADTFAEILNGMGIPAFTGSKTGYFSAVEIQTVLSLLKVIDNPRQDIPLVAVLRSPIVGISDEELALIRSSVPQAGFYEACSAYQGLAKLDDFMAMLGDFRKHVPYTTIHELLWYIFEKTGYEAYVTAMPGGEQRAANLQMLVEKAMAYESTSYRGLFNFIRYIEQLKKYDVDYGEASILGEEEDTVRLMSIHKSKGLEFPVVFVSGMHKKFNTQDTKSKLVLHPELGTGCDFVDAKLRIKTPTLLKKLIQRQTTYENLGEELRVLYVALTRAKEKLIMTGVAPKAEEKLQRWDHGLSFSDRAGAASYLDWIMPVFHDCEAGMFELQIQGIKELVVEESAQQLTSLYSREQLLGWDAEKVYDEALNKQLRQTFGFVYPWRDSADIYGKITVSELKTLRQSADREDDYEMYQEQPIVPLVPNFVEAREATGAVLGTIYHRFLECYDYCQEAETAAISRQAGEMVASGKLVAEEVKQIDLRKILRFVTSPLGKRMQAAAKAGKLFREQQFVLGMPAADIREKWQTEDMVLVQGIVDAYFYEAEEIVLVDYKTDFVPGQDTNYLQEKYGIQLQYYGNALEQMTGKRVKDKIIYSFWLQKALSII